MAETTPGEIVWGERTLPAPVGLDVVGLTLPDDPAVTALAHFTAGDAAGQVAAADVRRGAGLVRVLGFSAGTVYERPVEACLAAAFSPSFIAPSLDQRPAGYDGALREAVVEVLAAQGLEANRPVVPSDPRVEGQLVLDHAGPDGAGAVTGGAVVLQNERNDAPSDITVEVPHLAGCVVDVVTGARFDVVEHRLSLSLGDEAVLGFTTAQGDCQATYDGP